MATPYSGKVFRFHQPDGTEFQVRGFGDQHNAIFETLDGYSVVKDPRTDFYTIAQLSADATRLEPAPGPVGNLNGEATPVPRGVRPSREASRARGLEGRQRFGGRRCDERRERHRALVRAGRELGAPFFAPPQRQTVGDFIGLCLLIDFSDAPGTISRQEVENFCNQQGYSGFGNNGSVFDYFHQNSLGRCRYRSVVANYYRALHPKTYYTDRTIEQGTRARELIVEALTHWKANGMDFSSLTADSEGFVFAMNVYYAGSVDNNWAEGLWPHAWHLATPVPLTPNASAFDYQFTAMESELTLGTFCHENGHMLCDYPDLYDYGYESSGVGAFCLMCAGGNIDERNPIQISAYLKRLSGWAGSVTAVEHDREIALTASNNEFAIFTKTSGEYFLMENRRKAGRDISLPDEGLAIWHVDEAGSNSNEQRTATQHYELSLEQADGRFDLERTRNTIGDGSDLYDSANSRFSNTTSPDSKWWDGSASNLEIYDISDPGDVVRFKSRLFQDSGGALDVKAESAPGLNIPDNAASGAADNISIDSDLRIATAKVSVDITHAYRGDLRVTLRSPWGAEIRLHDRGQGSADDLRVTYDESSLPALATLRNRSMRGDWTLFVQDLAPADTGRLNRWGLEFIGAAEEVGSVILEDAPGTHIPDKNTEGIVRNLSTSESGTVASVEVRLNITHTYIGDLRVALRSPAGTEVVLHSQTGGASDNLVTTYTAVTTPGLAGLNGQPISGTWSLQVSDLASQDVGKLNAWRLTLGRA